MKDQVVKKYTGSASLKSGIRRMKWRGYVVDQMNTYGGSFGTAEKYTVVFKKMPKAQSSVDSPAPPAAASAQANAGDESGASGGEKLSPQKERQRELNALYKAQRPGISGRDRFLPPKTTTLARALSDEEHVDRVFYARVNDQTAESSADEAAESGGAMGTVVLTDRRLLAAYGLLERTVSIDYPAISQIQTRESMLEVAGVAVRSSVGGLGGKQSDVDVQMTGVPNLAEVASDLERHRDAATASATDAVHFDADGVSTESSASTAAQSEPAQALGVADELKKLAELRDSGVLSEEEFEAQKAKLLTG